MLRHDDGCASPFDAPLFEVVPTYYRQARLQTVMFRTDPARVAALVPEPLKPSPDGICAAVGVDVPFSSTFGSFTEIFVVEKVLWRERSWFYLSHLFLDNDAAIACGRELYGSPKKMAQMSCVQDGPVATTTAARAGRTVATIQTVTTEVISPSELPNIGPVLTLKLIPRVDRPAPAIKQLTTTSLDNPHYHRCLRGTGIVEFPQTVVSHLHLLHPLDYLGAWEQVMDYSQGWGSVVYDYLARE